MTTEEIRAQLLAWCPPGTTIYSVLRHVNKNGDKRWIDMFVVSEGAMVRISWHVAKLLDMDVNKGRHDGLQVEGSGQDVGFMVAYHLASVLYREGFVCLGRDNRKSCPSNDHFNGDRNYEPHAHTEGGYALRHEWL